jgi:hypothetical protein
MKKTIAVFCVALSLAGCAAVGDSLKNAGDTIKGAMEQEAANRKMPEGLIGTWNLKDYLNHTLVITQNDFTLQIYKNDGKLWQTYSGPISAGTIRNVDNNMHFIAPVVTGLTQDGENLDHLPKKGGPNFKPMYYKDLTADSVMIYIVGATFKNEKGMHDHDEDSKVDRNYKKFTRAK